MRTLLKHIVSKTYKPILGRYLSTTRNYSYKGIHLSIPPEVFHPGFFTSTQFLLQYILRLSLHQKKVLELGAGSGLIAITAAKKGAIVTASDINPIAIEYLHSNSINNNVILEIIQSDLFTYLPEIKYDIMIINPPYYKKNQQSWKDYAWYCGEKGEYFSKLFRQLKNHTDCKTEVLMVLCDGCDIDMITNFASDNDFTLFLKQSKQTVLEKNFIYQVKRTDTLA